MRLEKELEIALQAVHQASLLCIQARKTLISEETISKKDRSPVTVADFGSQSVIILALRKAFPDVPIIGEETSTVLRENAEVRGKVMDLVTGQMPETEETEMLDAIDAGAGDAEQADQFWTVDPIDGTKGFLRGDQFAVALALIRNGEPVLGVLGCPHYPLEEHRGAIFYGVKGEGAFVRPLDDRPAQPVGVSDVTRPAQARFCESVESAHAAHDVHARISETLGITEPPFRMDSQAKYAAVASGKASIYLRLPRSSDYREKIWDHAAGAIVVEAAGGRVTDFSGGPLRFTAGRTLVHNEGIVGTNGHLHDAVLDAIRSVRG